MGYCFDCVYHCICSDYTPNIEDNDCFYELEEVETFPRDVWYEFSYWRFSDNLFDYLEDDDFIDEYEEE